ncbi:hypothetical protein Esti_001502 [Eimeria stiedai]
MESHVHQAACFSAPSVAASSKSFEALPKEATFAVLCEALARLLESAYCEQDIKCSNTEDETTAFSEASATVGLDTQLLPAADTACSPNPCVEQDVAASVYVHSDEHLNTNKNVHNIKVALFGSVRFSGSFSCNLEGGFCCVGPGKTAPAWSHVPLNHMRLCGEATIRWPSGATYRGQVAGGLRHGRGTYTSADRRFVYEGEWHQGTPNGWGVLDCSDGTQYRGEWVGGRRHGFGVQTSSNGSRYEGQWVEGKQEGQGVMLWNEPAVHYVGEWRGGTQAGWGRQTWLEHPAAVRGTACSVGRNLQQNRYEGFFKEGRREGVGAFSYSNGARYEGAWVANKKHGLGKYKSESGSLYEGIFIQDRMAGKPPETSEDPLQALVDLSEVQQVEVYRHLEARKESGVCNQLPACERLAARTVRSVYHTMLRNMCILRRVYAAYRRLAPMPHTDPYILSCAQFWCLAFDADLLTPLSTLYETAKILFSPGNDETFQEARRISGGLPATLTVIEAQRRRSMQNSSSLSLAWGDLCQKLHIFSDVLEAQIEQHLEGNSKKHGQTPEKEDMQPQPSADSTAGESCRSESPADATVNEERTDNQIKSPLKKGSGTEATSATQSSGGGGVTRQQRQNIKLSTMASKDYLRASLRKGAAETSRAQAKAAKLQVQTEAPVHAKEAECLAPNAGSHVHSFGQAALAETICILDDFLHKTLFPERKPSSNQSHNYAEKMLRSACRRSRSIQSVMFPSAGGSPSAARPANNRSRRSCSTGSSLAPRFVGGRGKPLRKAFLLRFQCALLVSLVFVALCEEAYGLLAATPLKTFALPAACILAILQEVLPIHSAVSSSSKIGDAVEFEQQQVPNEGQATDAAATEQTCAEADHDSASPQQAEMYRLQQKQQQELSVLKKRQQELTQDIRRGFLRWSEMAANPVTMLEVQRLFLRLVELRMPPMIATFLSLKQQVEGFLHLLSAAASVIYRADQRQTQHQLQEALPTQDVREVQDHRQSPLQDDSPTAHSDTSIATTATGFTAETVKCFWNGFCGSSLARQLCDAPLRLDEHSASEASKSESSDSEAADDALGSVCVTRCPSCVGGICAKN